jgi:Fic family protein
MAPSVLRVHMSQLEREGLRMLSEQQGVSEEWVLKNLLRTALPADWDYQDRKPKRDIWKQIKAYAVERVDAQGYVSATNLARGVGISPVTAGKYIDRLIVYFEWTSEPAHRPPRGRVAGPKV